MFQQKAQSNNSMDVRAKQRLCLERRPLNLNGLGRGFAPRHLSRWASAFMVSIENKTLEELDGKHWDEPKYDSSLVLNCHRLRRVPLKDFSVGDLRLMIGQGFSLGYLVPLALTHMESDPFAEGNFYRGDLLNNVLEINHEFWEQNPQLHRKMRVIVRKAKVQLKALDENEIEEKIKEKLNAFD